MPDQGRFPPIIVLVLALMVFGVKPIRAEEVVVAAASSLNFAVKEMVTEFEAQTGYQVRLSLGSSGSFYAQISNGAPFEVFLSADVGYAKALEEAGLVEPGTFFIYSVGRIVLWVSTDSPVDLKELQMGALLHPSVKKIAIANPRHAPYGRAAEEALRSFKVHNHVKDKIVYGEHQSQAAQFVQSGAAEIGILALSQALSPILGKAGRFWEIPSKVYSPLPQSIVILKTARAHHNLRAVRIFYDWVKGSFGQAVLRKYGLSFKGETVEEVDP